MILKRLLRQATLNAAFIFASAKTVLARIDAARALGRSEVQYGSCQVMPVMWDGVTSRSNCGIPGPVNVVALGALQFLALRRSGRYWEPHGHVRYFWSSRSQGSFL